VQFGEIVGVDAGDPVGETFAVPADEHLREGGDVPGDGVQVGALGPVSA
jgi:hypothetical protein